jgi:hypothetical protein
LGYIWFPVNRGASRTGYHLSKAAQESYYALYDIDPTTVLNNLRFCRKVDIRPLIEGTNSCSSQVCTANCLNVTLPSESDDTRFGFYACLPQTSLAGIVYTQAFPELSDFIRPNLPMDYSVALRRNSNESLTLSFTQVNQTLGSSCYEYLNFDDTSPSDNTIALTCGASNPNNFTMSGIVLKQNFNSLLTAAFQNRRMSGHHTRYIDYQLSK